MSEIRLFLNGTEADLQTGWTSGILMTYQISDVLEPSAVKNSYSKTVSLPGTTTNNRIFGNYWQLDSYNGNFNPIRKGNFSLYIDSELYQSGYFKLDSVGRRGSVSTYNITLYGGLGEFLYNLEYASNGEKLQFKDLSIIKDIDYPFVFSDIGFDITKESVNNAWDYINTYGSNWSIVNFMPAYEGVPADFGADKALINTSSVDIFGQSAGGWAIGELDREITCLEARDLRSYLQRPVLRVQPLLESLRLPENNGGWEVDFDTHFFHQDNPYYMNSWVTLPKLQEMVSEDTDTVETVTGATIIDTSTERWGSSIYEVHTDADFSDFNNLKFEFQANVSVTGLNTNDIYLCTRQFHSPGGIILTSKWIKNYSCYSGFLLQLVALDANDSIVGFSNVYQLLGRIWNGTSWLAADFSDKIDLTDFDGASVETLYGHFHNSGGTYTWYDTEGNPQSIVFKLNSNTSWHRLVLRVQRPYHEYYKRTFTGGEHVNRQATGAFRMYSVMSLSDSTKYTLDECQALHAGSTAPAFNVSEFEVSATRYGGFLSGKHISHEKLLSLEMTPAQFLLNFCKIFGLYIWAEPTKKIIHIQDRDTFYTSDIVDLKDFLDRGTEITIRPSTDVAYYDFNFEAVGNESQGDYLDNYGQEYGLHRVNTGYEFNADHKEGYTGDFKGASTVLESSPYYYTGVNHVPCWVWNGLKYTTYSVGSDGLEGTEHSMDIYTVGSAAWGEAYNAEYPSFDTFSKVQLHGEDNEGVDGDMVLVFLNNPYAALGAKYWITDDIEQMVRLNSKEPCWILTDTATDSANNTIAIERSYVPQFTRDLINFQNYITHSWEFGKPLENYIPATNYQSGGTVYERLWKSYVADLYDRNTIVVTANVLLRGKPDSQWLRHFYSFDNSYWRINKIVDWNPLRNGTTKVEFVKVQDIDNYALEQINYEAAEFSMEISGYTLENEEIVNDYITIKYYTIPSGATEIVGQIIMTDGSYWTLGTDGRGSGAIVEYEDGTLDYPWYSDLIGTGQTDYGYGSANRTFYIGANDSGQYRTWKLCALGGAANDYYRWCYVKQLADGTGNLTVTRFGGTGNLSSGATYALMTVYSTSPWTGSSFHGYETLTPTTGNSGYTTVRMDVTQNPDRSERECKVRFANDDGEVVDFALTQNPNGEIVSLSMNLDTYGFDDPGVASINGYVECPTAITSWYLTSDNWISFYPTGGTPGTTNITVTSTENETGDERFGVLQLWNGDTSALADTIHLSQPARAEQNLTVTRFGGTGNLSSGDTFALATVYSTSPWTATTNDAFVSLHAYTGVSGYTNIQIDVAENPSGTERAITIVFLNSEGITTTFTLTQNPAGVLPELNLVLSTYGFDDPGVVTINGFVECPSGISGWYITTDNWMAASPTAGTSGTTIITVTSTYNNSGADRYGVVQLWNADTQTVSDTINMSQPAPTGTTTINYTTSGSTALIFDSSVDWGGMTMIENSYDSNGGRLVFLGIMTEIPANSFSGQTGLTSIELPDSITGIGNYAFYNCNALSSVTFGNALTSIGRYSFGFCGALSDMSIPSGLTSLGYGAFSNCASLEAVTIPSTLSALDGYIFYGCTSLSSVTLESGITEIGIYCFQSCTDLRRITIPDSVTTIGNHAFRGSRLNDITIPDSVTSLGTNCFRGCTSMTGVTIGSGITAIADNTFASCSALNRIVIPDTVSTIGLGAFSTCTSLSQMIIGSGVTSIGNAAFLNCSGLSVITCYATTAPTISAMTFNTVALNGTLHYPAGADYSTWLSAGEYYLGYYGWIGQSISGLSVINYTTSDSQPLTLNTSITWDVGIIDNYYDSTGGHISFNGTLTTIPNSGFSAQNTLTYIEIPNSVSDIGSKAFYYSRNLTGITIPNSVRSIGSQAFYNCNALTGVTLPNLTTLESNLFQSCTSLTNVTIPSSVTSMSHNIFKNCTALTSVTIPNSVTEIGNQLVYGCTALTSITIPNSVTTIGHSLFTNCTNLQRVTLGSGITDIPRIFRNCSALTELYCYATTAPTVISSTFQEIAQNGTLYTPSGSDYLSWMDTSEYYLGYYGWTWSDSL